MTICGARNFCTDLSLMHTVYKCLLPRPLVDTLDSVNTHWDVWQLIEITWNPEANIVMDLCNFWLWTSTNPGGVYARLIPHMCRIPHTHPTILTRILKVWNPTNWLVAFHGHVSSCQNPAWLLVSGTVLTGMQRWSPSMRLWNGISNNEKTSAGMTLAGVYRCP